MTIPTQLSTKTVGFCGLVLSMSLSSTAFALPAIGSVAVGNGVATTGHVVDIPLGGSGGPGLVTVTALSPHTSKQGSVANVMLLNSQRLVGVTGQASAPGNGIGIANPTGRPVFSAVSNLPSLNGATSPQ